MKTSHVLGAIAVAPISSLGPRLAWAGDGGAGAALLQAADSGELTKVKALVSATLLSKP